MAKKPCFISVSSSTFNRIATAAERQRKSMRQVLEEAILPIEAVLCAVCAVRYGCVKARGEWVCGVCK